MYLTPYLSGSKGFNYSLVKSDIWSDFIVFFSLSKNVRSHKAPPPCSGRTSELQYFPWFYPAIDTVCIHAVRSTGWFWWSEKTTRFEASSPSQIFSRPWFYLQRASMLCWRSFSVTAPRLTLGPLASVPPPLRAPGDVFPPHSQLTHTQETHSFHSVKRKLCP